MENSDINNLLGQEQSDTISLDKEAMQYLYDTAKWGQFIAIVFFCIIGLMVVLAFTVSTILSGVDPEISKFGGFGIGMTIMYLIFAVIYFIPTLNLYRFSAQAKRALKSRDEIELKSALGRLKSVFKFWGIFVIVMLVLYGILFLFVGAAGLSAFQ